MPSVDINDGDFDACMRRFKRLCERSGILAQLRKKEFYEKPTAKRKRMRAAAVKRHHKKLQKEREILERSRSRARGRRS